MVLDPGASTVLFFFGVFLAAAAVAAGTAERLQDGTTTLVLTKPVGPLGVLAGGFLGAALALVEAGGRARVGPPRDAQRPRRAARRGGRPRGPGPVPGLVGGARQRRAAHDRLPAGRPRGALLLLLPLSYLVVLGLDGSHATGEHASHDATALAAATLAMLAALAYAALGVRLGTRLPPAGAAVLTLVVGFVLGSLVQAAGRDAGAPPPRWRSARPWPPPAGCAWLVGVAWHVSPGWAAAARRGPPLRRAPPRPRARPAGPAPRRRRRARARGHARRDGAPLPRRPRPAVSLPGRRRGLRRGPRPRVLYVAEVALSTAAYCAGALGVGALVLGGRELPT